MPGAGEGNEELLVNEGRVAAGVGGVTKFLERGRGDLHSNVNVLNTTEKHTLKQGRW